MLDAGGCHQKMNILLQTKCPVVHLCHTHWLHALVTPYDHYKKNVFSECSSLFSEKNISFYSFFAPPCLYSMNILTNEVSTRAPVSYPLVTCIDTAVRPLQEKCVQEKISGICWDTYYRFEHTHHPVVITRQIRVQPRNCARHVVLRHRIFSQSRCIELLVLFLLKYHRVYQTNTITHCIHGFFNRIESKDIPFGCPHTAA
jgi:hypothetical protein